MEPLAKKSSGQKTSGELNWKSQIVKKSQNLLPIDFEMKYMALNEVIDKILICSKVIMQPFGDLILKL